MGKRKSSPRYSYPQSARNLPQKVDSDSVDNPVDAPPKRIPSASYDDPEKKSINWGNVAGVAVAILTVLTIIFWVGADWEGTKRDITELQSDDKVLQSGVQDIHQNLEKISTQVQSTNDNVNQLRQEIATNKKRDKSEK